MDPIVATSIIAGTSAYAIGVLLGRSFASLFALWVAVLVPIIAFA